MKETKRYNIVEIEALTGVSRRTIRFYVQRGLLDAPCGAGRGHYYTDAHVAQLRHVLDGQAHGLSLDAIARSLHRRESTTPPTLNTPGATVGVCATDDPGLTEHVPGLWLRIPILPGLELHLESGRTRPSPARLDQLRHAARAILALPESPADTDNL